MQKQLILAIVIAVLTISVAAQAPEVPVLVPDVIRIYPHDDNAFTQGLLWDSGFLYESTGLRGQSTLRRVEIETGRPLETVSLADDLFAEGLEHVGDTLIQLTWQAGLAVVYDFNTFEHLDTISYDGEGWGLCYDGRYLFMSDGSSYLSIRDPGSFDLIFRGAVTYNGQILPASLLNELECVDDYIYANAWNTDYIFQIDKFTGDIVAVIDASSLLTEAEKAALDHGSVLNGIAYNPESMTFYVTGKRWPKIFEVVFVES
ncbi:MAG: glutaminyl-peptide cyclotransferase [Chloroflexi bacterium]|nr:glutaminyl-peptide cyclotransferase [Chloroflexota bacterium]